MGAYSIDFSLDSLNENEFMVLYLLSKSHGFLHDLLWTQSFDETLVSQKQNSRASSPKVSNSIMNPDIHCGLLLRHSLLILFGRNY